MDTQLCEDLQSFLIDARQVFRALGMGQGEAPTYTPEELMEALLHERHDNAAMVRTASTLIERITQAHARANANAQVAAVVTRYKSVEDSP
tara:strand:- start:94 stop:366 length:273 start_codon:yes stop_codon:yes gene_type:complete